MAQPSPTTIPDLTGEWGAPLQAIVCEACDWSYLAPANLAVKACPRCFRGALAALDEQIDELPYTHSPESFVPFTLGPGKLDQSVQTFAKGIPFAPKDLSTENLRKRLQRLYLPVWLVDAQVNAHWQAEAGFDYQVVSHQDNYSDGRGWNSRQVEETRIRWEPRAGDLKRTYHNIVASALEEEGRIKAAVGRWDLSKVQPYRPEALERALVRLPNRGRQDAWGMARPAFQKAAAEECRQATAADHIRSYTWNAEYVEQNWTLLLLPLYTTYYLDDERKAQTILVHGQNGRIQGVRKASMKRAQRAALIVLVVALVIFLIGLGLALGSLVAPPLLAAGGLGLAAALIVGLGAFIPVTTAWWFNRQGEDAVTF